jgi:hypothetical protein
MKLVPLMLLFATGIYADSISLTLSSASGSPGQTVDLGLTLGGTPQAAGLQWTLTYPAADLSSILFSDGPAAIAADKSLQCGPNTNGSIICLIFGINTNIIDAGTVATLSATIAPAPPDEIIPLALSGLVAVDPAGSEIGITGTGGTITVQAVPEPSSFALLLAIGFVFVIGLHKLVRRNLIKDLPHAAN